MNELLSLFETIGGFFVGTNWQMFIMWIIGGVLIFLAIKKEMEPTLLLPIGFGAILMNFPGVVKLVCENPSTTCQFSTMDLTVKACEKCGGALSQALGGIAEPLETLYHAGIASELFPLILFIGIGAMIDFGPLLSNPKLMIFGAAAQFGILIWYLGD